MSKAGTPIAQQSVPQSCQSPDLDILMPYFRDAGVMNFSKMTLLARDHEPVVLEGSGRVELPSPDKMILHMTGRPVELRHTLFAINRPRDNPYEGLNHFRLQMTDGEGRSWSANCEVEHFEPGDSDWSLVGWTQAIFSSFTREDHPTGTAEVRYLIPQSFSVRGDLAGIIRTSQPDGTYVPCAVVDVPGCPVTLRYDVEIGMLIVSVPTSEQFPGYKVENWLGEPLCILLGQLVYPRLVERRLPGGHCHVSLRASPGWSVDSRWTALWRPDEADTETSFLELYRGLLIIIASDSGYEAHEITSLFVEVIEASRGSRWVIALTLASAIEAMVKRLSERKRTLTEKEMQAICDMRAFVKTWSAPDHLKQRIRGYLGGVADIPVSRALKSLGIGDAESIETWKKMRNSVAHGELVSPYSSEEQDGALLAFARLFHALTKEDVRRVLARE